MFFYVYVLLSSKDKDLYVGLSTNLVKRLKERNQGLNRSTQIGKPWKLIY